MVNIKVIIAIPDRLGDTIFHTPFFRLLKTINPHIKIDVIAPTILSASVLHYNPRINKIFLNPSEDDLEALKNNYDLAIDLNASKLSGAAIKRINAEQIMFMDTCVGQRHMAEQSLQFFSKVFDYDISNFDRSYELYPQQSNFTHIQNLLQGNGVDLNQHKLIAFHMGCHGLAKKRSRLWGKLLHKKAWPIKNFIKLAREVKKTNKNIKIILTGSKEEIQLAKMFCKKHPDAINLINQTSVLDLAALMSFIKLLISNDTGLVHIACSTQVPIIALYLVHSAGIVGPYPEHPNRIVINGTKISVSEVLKNAEPFIS